MQCAAGKEGGEMNSVGAPVTFIGNCHLEDFSPDLCDCFLILKYIYYSLKGNEVRMIPPSGIIPCLPLPTCIQAPGRQSLDILKYRGQIAGELSPTLVSFFFVPGVIFPLPK